MTVKNIVKSAFTDIDIPNISVGEYVYNKLKQLNDEPVLVEAKTDQWITAKQLLNHSSNTANALIRRGITKSDIICCFSHNNLSYVKLKIAAYFLGVTISESSPINNIHELENNLRISEPTYLFASRAHIPLVEQLLEKKNNVKQPKLIVVLDAVYGKYLTFDELTEEANRQTLSKIPYFDVNPKTDICEILYTSGTSGLSKAAMLSNYALVAMLQTFYTFDNQTSTDNQIVILYYSLAHSSGTLSLPLWLCSGIKIVLLEYFNEELVLKSIEKFKVTLVSVMPLFGYNLADGLIGNNYDLSSIEIFSIAGTHFAPSAAEKLIEKFHTSFINMYVMTEFSVFAWNDDREFVSGSCGRVAPNVELKIVDLDTNENLEANKDGEICVRGPTLFSGYLKNENATKEAIDSDGWFHTGDVGHYDDTGRLFVTDRVKELIKYGMSSVAPAEIEQFLLKKDGVQDVVVIGVPYKTGIYLPRAYVKLAPGFSVTAEEIKKYVTENMTSKNELRGGVVFVDTVVKSIIGKADRKYYKNLIKNEIQV